MHLFIARSALRLALLCYCVFFPRRYARRTAARGIKRAHLTFNYSAVAIYSKQRVASMIKRNLTRRRSPGVRREIRWCANFARVRRHFSIRHRRPKTTRRPLQIPPDRYIYRVFNAGALIPRCGRAKKSRRSMPRLSRLFLVAIVDEYTCPNRDE